MSLLKAEGFFWAIIQQKVKNSFMHCKCYSGFWYKLIQLSVTEICNRVHSIAQDPYIIHVCHTPVRFTDVWLYHEVDRTLYDTLVWCIGATLKRFRMRSIYQNFIAEWGSFSLKWNFCFRIASVNFLFSFFQCKDGASMDCRWHL